MGTAFLESSFGQCLTPQSGAAAIAAAVVVLPVVEVQLLAVAYVPLRREDDVRPLDCDADVHVPARARLVEEGERGWRAPGHSMNACDGDADRTSL